MGDHARVHGVDAHRDKSVEPRHLNLDPKQADVATSESTTSTSYTDLATVGPEVTAEIGPNGLALVIVSAFAESSVGGVSALVSYSIDGAAASDDRAGFCQSTTGSTVTRATIASGLSAGSHTFTAKYRLDGAATATFLRRRIIVIPL